MLDAGCSHDCVSTDITGPSSIGRAEQPPIHQTRSPLRAAAAAAAPAACPSSNERWAPGLRTASPGRREEEKKYRTQPPRNRANISSAEAPEAPRRSLPARLADSHPRPPAPPTRSARERALPPPPPPPPPPAAHVSGLVPTLHARGLARRPKNQDAQRRHHSLPITPVAGTATARARALPSVHARFVIAVDAAATFHQSQRPRL